MKRIVWILLCAHSLFSYTDLAVTYEFSRGRFGDNVLAYLHAKWFAYQRNILLLYKPFQFSSQLAMHRQEKHYGTMLGTHAYMRHYLARGPVNPAIQLPILYICPYFPEDRWELEATCDMSSNPWYHFDVDWKDPEFRKIAREMVAPAHPLILPSLPANAITIALHVREGGGYDSTDSFLYWPLKIPPLTYYVESLKRVLAYLPPGKTLYCHLFTDAANPREMAERIEREVPSIKLVFRKTNNHHNRNVLEDFFSLFKFDILIRSQSNFALVPSLINDYAILVAPRDCKIFGDVVTITETDFIVNQPLLDEALRK